MDLAFSDLAVDISESFRGLRPDHRAFAYTGNSVLPFLL